MEALAVGAVLTPTDPVFATAVMEGEAAKSHIPKRLRHFLLAESGSNDRLAFPLVMLPVLLRPLLGPVRGRAEAWFYGWFGPIGIAPLGFAVLVWERTQNDTLWAIRSPVIASSVAAHGVTATPFSKRLPQAQQVDGDDPAG